MSSQWRLCDASLLHVPPCPADTTRLLLLTSPLLVQLVTLAVSLGGVVTILDNEVLRPVVVLAAEVRLEDVLRAGGVPDLGVDRGTRHVRNSGVSAAPWVLGGTERVVLGSWLWEPDITTVAAELAALKRLSNVFLDNNGTTSGIDEPCTCL